MLRPLIRPIVRPLVRGVTEPGFGWSPIVLFAAGEQGAWYDPSDVSTLFQNSAGTTPVTALGQAVGLILDKSKGLALGPERVTNGTFDSDTVWVKSASATISGGGCNLTSAASGESTSTPVIPLDVRPYLASFSVRNYVSGSVGIKVGNGMTTVAAANGEFSSLVYSSGVNTLVEISVRSVNTTLTVDNVSVRELPGSHASQPTATARPVLAAGNKIDFDGVDDKLTTTFPDLGSNVTIVRSVPGTGASILTGQTIGAGARDDSTDHHGLLIINRALTAPETALVTRWANMRAGV